MICPFAEFRGPLPATNYANGPTAKRGVVHHVIVGSLSSADAEFHGNGAMLSAHFGVADGRDAYPDGWLVQWLDTDVVSYAQMAGNGAYISVETAGQPTDPWTAAQIATLARLDVWASQHHRFPLALCDHGGAGLTTHAFYPSGIPDPAWGGHACPGHARTGEMPVVLAAALALIEPPAPPINHPGDNVTRYAVIVQTGPDGHGTADTLIPFPKALSVTLNGDDDNVALIADAAINDHAGATRVTVQRGPASGTVEVFLVAAD